MSYFAFTYDKVMTNQKFAKLFGIEPRKKDQKTEQIHYDIGASVQKVLEDITKKRISLENDINNEISAAEDEINKLKKSSDDKINKIAVETSSDIIKKLIGEEVNNSSISAIVEDLSKKNKEKINGI